MNKITKCLINSERIVNAIIVMFVILITTTLLIVQFSLHKLPCPSGLLQRVGLIAIAFGFLLNLKFGPQRSHYCIILLSSLFTCFAALKRAALQIIPGTETPSASLFGLHFHTLSFIISTFLIIATTLLLGMNRSDEKNYTYNHSWKIIINSLFIIILLITLINLIAALLQCGLAPCPDNPTEYKLLK